MRRSIFAASIAAVALIPSTAIAQDNCERHQSARVVGTVAGAGVGGALGNVIAGRGDKTIGTIIGAVVGGVVGNQVAKPSSDCSRAFGYYDENNRWHATGVSSSQARGYYDRDGRWVDGPPNGYYGQGNRWISNAGTNGADGSYNSRGEWVPVSVDGYYDRNGQWIAGTASGYYNERGRWVAGVTTGHYDARGRWIAGTARGRRDASGVWIADPQPGYYDTRGRWHVGQTSGYYDSRGRWVSTVSGANGQIGPGRGIVAQVNWLEQYVGHASSQRTLNNREASRAQRELRSIREREQSMRHDSMGNLSRRDQAALQVRLDRVSDRLQINPS
jgi:hypothetical protein